MSESYVASPTGAAVWAASAGARLRRVNWPFWVALALALAAWDIVAANVANSLVFVPLASIWKRAVSLWQEENLWRDMVTSGLEFLLGYGVAIVMGIVVGTISGHWRRAGRVIDPFVNAAYAMPVIALGPLFIIALGLGIASKVAIVALAAVFPIILNTAAGIAATERSHIELGRAFCLTDSTILWKISLPSSVPYILAGMRVAVGRGLTAIVAGELFGAQAGLGLRILTSATTFDTAGVFVATLILSIAGVLLNQLLHAVEVRIAPWRVT